MAAELGKYRPVASQRGGGLERVRGRGVGVGATGGPGDLRGGGQTVGGGGRSGSEVASAISVTASAVGGGLPVSV